MRISIRSPFGTKPSRASVASATAVAATWHFMSTLPRPQIAPSRSTAANGSTVQSWRRAWTTSRWPRNASDGPSPRPRRRARRFGRSGSFATRSHSIPNGWRYAPSTAAACASRPGGFDVSHAISRCNSVFASSCAGSDIGRRPLRRLDEPAREAVDSLTLAYVALPIGSVPGQQRARAVQLLRCVEAVCVRLELVEETRDPLARLDPCAAVEIDEPAADAVAVRAPRVLRDPVRLVD